MNKNAQEQANPWARNSSQWRGMLLSNNKNLPEAEMHKHKTSPKGAEVEQNLIKTAVKSLT